MAFVGRMIDESKALGDRCQWFTSMLGKYLSVEVIVEWLRESGVDNWAVRDLVQGNKTRRWAVAWSWGAMRPSLVRCIIQLSSIKLLYSAMRKFDQIDLKLTNHC